MMNTINPSVAEIDAAINVLTVLEMAKDATSLKATLQELKDAQDAAAAERNANEEAVAALSAKGAEIDRKQGLLEQEQARIDAEHAKNQKNADDVAADRAAMKQERDEFDRWMAAEREGLANAQAAVAAGADQNNKRAESLARSEADLAKRIDAAEAAKAAAEAKRTEYEAKMANLKAMVG